MHLVYRAAIATFLILLGASVAVAFLLWVGMNHPWLGIAVITLGTFSCVLWYVYMIDKVNRSETEVNSKVRQK